MVATEQGMMLGNGNLYNDSFRKVGSKPLETMVPSLERIACCIFRQHFVDGVAELFTNPTQPGLVVQRTALLDAPGTGEYKMYDHHGKPEAAPAYKYLRVRGCATFDAALPSGLSVFPIAHCIAHCVLLPPLRCDAAAA